MSDLVTEMIPCKCGMTHFVTFKQLKEYEKKFAPAGATHIGYCMFKNYSYYIKPNQEQINDDIDQI